MHIDLDTLSGAQRYFHMIDVVVPRPIAWVSTLSNTGLRNLAPFSFFTAVSSSPPCIMLSVAPKRKGRIKDTLSNIEATGEFVVNLVQADLAKPMVETSAEFESDQDEFTECDVLSSPRGLLNHHGLSALTRRLNAICLMSTQSVMTKGGWGLRW